MTQTLSPHRSTGTRYECPACYDFTGTHNRNLTRTRFGWRCQGGVCWNRHFKAHPQHWLDTLAAYGFYARAS